MSVGPAASAAPPPTRRALAELLAEARARTLLLVSPLNNETIMRRPDPPAPSIMAQLDQIVRFEARWLLDETVGGGFGSYDEWFDTMMDVRQRVLQRLDEAGWPPLAERHRLVLEHEYQRGEVIIESLQVQGEPYEPVQRRALPRGRRLADPGFMTRFPGGTVEIGGTEHQATWAAERPLHRVTLEPFWIDVMPVTNGDFMTFMGEGGYTEHELWSEDGWHWVKSLQAQMPASWFWQDGMWWTRWMGRDAPIDLTFPVSQVSFYEAEAFARFVGKRLPTETEWETAASWDPEAPSRRHFPWGNMPPTSHVANLDQLAWQPAAIGAFPGNLSPLGCYGMIGDLWEWTSSDFVPYPGYEGSGSERPARLRSEAKVLRGGSWATRPGAIRVSVRRPGLVAARHMFTGFRCARNA